MMRTLLVSCVVASALFCAPALAQTPVDASRFDIAGVQLGMTLDEAKSALVKHFGAEHEDAIRVLNRRNPMTGKDEPSALEFKTDNESVGVELMPDVTGDGTLIVHSIGYKLPWSQDNAERLRVAALQKYGPASSPESFTETQWCGDADKYPGSVCNYSEGPNLKATGTRLVLSDPSLVQRLTDWFVERQSATPRF